MKRVLGAFVVFAAIIVLTLVFVTRRQPVRVGGLGAAGDRPFGDGDVIAAAGRAVFDFDGRRLAVVTGNGLGVAANGIISPVTSPGTNVVDAAWFPNGSTLLVAEGPVPTGMVAVVEADGRVRGSIRLEPSIGFGDGYGMVVAAGGRRAVVTAVERRAFAPPVRHLVSVDLGTGATRSLTDAGGPDEEGPFLPAGDRLAFTSVEGDGLARAVVADLDGAVTDVLGPGRVVGVAGSSVIVVGPDDIVRRFDAGRGAPVELGSIPHGSLLTSVDAVGGVAVVLESGIDGANNRATHLRRVVIRRSPIAPDRPGEGYRGGP